MNGGFQAGSIVGKLVLDKKNWTQSVSGVKTDMKNMGGMSDTMKAKFKAAGTAMTIAGAAIVGALGSMVLKASEAEETYAKFGTVFKDVIGDAEIAAADLAESYGLSTLASKDLLAATGDLLTGLGVESDAALDLSLKTQQLAVDLASFTNFSGGAKGASEALTKAMLGERESIKSLGIVITEEMVKEALLAEGKEELTGLAYKQAAAEVTLTIAMNQSKNAIGDYERTSTSFANQSRLLKSRLEDVAVTLGTQLLPIATQMVTKITEVVQKISTWTAEHPKLTNTLVKVIAALGSLMLVLGPFLIILPKLVAGLKLLKGAFIKMTGPIGLVVAGLILIIAKAIEAREEFKEMSDMYQRESELMGTKTSWFERTLGSLSAAYDKLVLGIDTNRIAQVAYTEAQRKAQGVMSIVKGTAWLLSDGVKFLGEKWQELVDILPGAEEGTEAVGEEIKYTTELAETAALNIGILTSTMGDFALKTVSVKEVLDNLKPVMTNVWEEAIPPARDFSGVLDLVPTKFEGIETASEETGTAVKSKWEEVTDGLKTNWTENLSDILQGTKSLEDGLKDIFGHIKDMFFDMIAQMVTQWIFEGVTSLISGAKTAASGISTAMTTVGSAIGGISVGIGTLITTLAQAIATAAGIIAAAAPEILIAAAVALVIYAGFLAISALFKKGPKKDVMQAIVDNTQKIFDAVHPSMNEARNYLHNIAISAGATNNKLDSIIGVLRKIKKSIVGAQMGLDMNITTPTLIAAHPGEHARITPAGQARHGDISLSFNITAGDGRDMERWLRSDGIRMIEDVLRQNLGGNAARIEASTARYRRY